MSISKKLRENLKKSTKLYFQRGIVTQYGIGVRLANYHEIVLMAMQIRDVGIAEIAAKIGFGDKSKFSKWQNCKAAPSWLALQAMKLHLGIGANVRPEKNLEAFWAYRKIVRWVSKKLHTQPDIPPYPILHGAEAEFLMEAHKTGIDIDQIETVFELIPSTTKNACPYFRLEDFRKLVMSDGRAHGIAILELLDALESGKTLHKDTRSTETL